MLRIDMASESDGPSILDITSESGVFNSTEVSCVEELWSEYKRSPIESGYYFLVSRDDKGTVTGFACYGPHALTEGTFDLFWIVVDPRVQGQGVGRALMKQVEAEVKRQSGRLIIIETSDSEPYIPAREFYSTCGYQREAQIHDFYSPGDSLVFFTKAINSA